MSSGDRFNKSIRWAGVIVLTLTCFLTTYAQLPEFSFRHLNPQKGLSDPTNAHITKDSKGIIWISSLQGLNRFDGQNIKVYRYDLNDTNSIGGNIVSSQVFEDKHQNLWLTTYQSLNKYIRKKDQFERFYLNDEDGSPIREDYYAFHIDEKQNLWIRLGTVDKGKLFLFNTIDLTYKYICPLEGHRAKVVKLGNNEFRIFTYLRDNYKAVGITDVTINDKGSNSSQLEKYTRPPESELQLNFYSVEPESKDVIWIGSSKGLIKYSLSDGKEEIFFEFQGDTVINITDIEPIDESKLLLGSDGAGLFLFDKTSERFVKRYASDPNNPLSLIDNSINGVIRDDDNNIWVQHWEKGIDYTNLQKTRFPTLIIPSSFDGLRTSITDVVNHKNGEIWVLTERDGVFRVDSNLTFSSLWIPSESERAKISTLDHLFISKEDKTYLSFRTDNSGKSQIWVFNEESQSFELIDKLPAFCYSIDQLNSGELIFSTSTGIFSLETNSSNFEYRTDLSPDSSTINALFEDDLGNLYIAVNASRIEFFKNIDKRYIESGEIQNAEYVYDHLKLPSGEIWFSTSLGIFEIDPKDFSYRMINEKQDGLENRKYYSMVCDDSGNIWLRSTEELIKYIPRSKITRHYSKIDGILSIENNNGKLLKDDLGRIWAIGEGGLNIFNPEKIEDIEFEPSILITNILINDEPYKTSQPPTEVDSLSLPYKLNTLSLHFSALEYSDPEAIEYFYRLKGYETQWVSSGNDGFIRYANIPPGDYTLEIRATNSDGKLSTKTATLDISISPPWYLTRWAIAGYILILIGIVYLIWKNQEVKQKRKLKAQQEKLQQEQEINKQLRKVDELKDQFLANTSHELRTPLNGIIGLTDSMIEGATGPLPHMTISQLEMIRSSGKRLSSLVNDILDFSKLKNKDLQLNFRPVDIHSIADIVVKLMQPIAEKKGLKILNNIPEDLPLVSGDENRLQQIFYNLLGNAIKFTPEGTIELNARAKGNFLEILVSDTGIGIPEEKQEMIFNWFEQGEGDTARIFGGTGLGLSVSKQLIELHHGEINVRSEVGKGSTFFFTIPISDDQKRSHAATPDSELEAPLSHVQEETTDYQQTSVAEEAIGKSKKSDSIHILIVDDEPVNLQVLENYLGNAGYMVSKALDGKQALHLIEQSEQNFDLIVLDIMMPYMSGYEVTEKIRKKYAPAELPIILLTAKNRVSDLMKGFEAGANDYLVKPFSKGELLSRIQSLLGIHQYAKATARFVPHEFLNRIGKKEILDVNLGDHALCSVTVLFADIRNYTRISEALSPEENFEFVSKYVGLMGPLIQKEDGFVNQYLGDGIMAIFPQNATYALRAAIAMQRTINLKGKELIDHSSKSISIGIGFHTGPLILGIIGDENRSDPATLADTVNIASRLEGLTKFFGANIVLSEESKQLLNDEAEFNLRYLGKVMVKGKAKPLSIYECFDGDPDEIIQLKKEQITIFNNALDHYYNRRFTDTCVILKSVIDKNPQDAVAKYFYRQAAKYMVDEPPENWTGVETMAMK